LARITFTRWPSATNPRGIRQSVAWDAFAQSLLAFRVLASLREKARLPGWSPATSSA
jgi:hypothetical protein